MPVNSFRNKTAQKKFTAKTTILKKIIYWVSNARIFSTINFRESSLQQILEKGVCSNFCRKEFATNYAYIRDAIQCVECKIYSL